MIRLLHMMLYMASQIRLHCQTTLGNGLADQASIRKVGSAQRLRYTAIFNLYRRPEVFVSELRHNG